MIDQSNGQFRSGSDYRGIVGPAQNGAMEVLVTIAPRPSNTRTRIATDGPFELAWAHILDGIFAHAASSGLAVVRFVLPGDELVPFVSARAEAFDLARRPRGGSAVALLTQDDVFPESADYVYLLHYGVLAPPALRRRRRPTPSGWRLLDSCSYFTIGARLLGIPIRVANLLHRADLADRAMTMMRRRFSRPGTSPAFYHLTVWGRRP